MHHLLKSADTPWLMVGADLRAREASAEWRRLRLPGGNTRTRDRIDTLFPQSDAAQYALDVLASGLTAENILIRMAGDGEDRILCANFHPYPSAGKPKKVLIEAWKIQAYLVLDGRTGEILTANEAAQELFGEAPRLPGQAAVLSAVEGALRTGSQYLGRFPHRRPDGREVELEAILALVEDTEPK